MHCSADDLPAAVRDLGMRLGVPPGGSEEAIVTLTQAGHMKRQLGSPSWMAFTARQTIAPTTCAFEWRARFGPLGSISVCDALADGQARLDVMALGFIPLARTAPTAALLRGERMRYLAELAWAPDAILANADLRWRGDGPDRLVVRTGDGPAAAEITMTLDGDGRIASTFAADRPRAAVEPTLPTPWRGRFSDYRLHLGRWLPFAGEVAWVIDGREEVYWRGALTSWSMAA
ncbi:hypothetical protein EDC65_1313 [Stella humosa]|uniref:Uncharacterized protein n=2 Tax=Stella humosa TaxID=94 RepID=A0A3N1M925_9PROT|nr:hypothetical protein EDC65_1313 [Stella humosa]BBK31252.1 hypothetical protein STHU_18860 [Stella humosa]